MDKGLFKKQSTAILRPLLFFNEAGFLKKKDVFEKFFCFFSKKNDLRKQNISGLCASFWPLDEFFRRFC